MRQVREADGLEPILRLAAVWQRIEEGPIRQTQQGTFFKRDRERLEDDPVLAGPITDALEPLPDMALLWIALARSVGLVVPEAGSDRLIAARPDFWGENAVHLPQMIATRWLALRDWHEQAGMRQEGSPVDLAIPFVRASVLLWLAKMPESAWLALDDLDEHLSQLAPYWDRPLLSDPVRPRGNGGPSPRRWRRSCSARRISSGWSGPRRRPRAVGESSSSRRWAATRWPSARRRRRGRRSTTSSSSSRTSRSSPIARV